MDRAGIVTLPFRIYRVPGIPENRIVSTGRGAYLVRREGSRVLVERIVEYAGDHMVVRVDASQEG